MKKKRINKKQEISGTTSSKALDATSSALEFEGCYRGTEHNILG